MVHIKAFSCNRPRKYYCKTNIKKRWLKQIEDEEANVEYQGDETRNCQKRSSERMLNYLPLKKRKILDLPENNEPILNEKSIQIDEDIAVLSTEDVQSAFGGTESVDIIRSEPLPQLHNKVKKNPS